MADSRLERKRFLNETHSKSAFDNPPNSRLFIIGSKVLSEEDYRNAFSSFGEIEELWVVKDRNTGDRKGIAYIKYSKTSEAAAALEAMNGKVIANSGRQLKVMVAAKREQGSKREDNEEEKLLRLFVIVPKTMKNDELQDIFKVYGEIEYAGIIKDKEKQESKGFAYVKYYKFSDAAAAFEKCDRKYRAVFAEPRKPRSVDNFEPVHSNHHDSPRGGLVIPDIDNGGGFKSLQVISSPTLNQDQIWKLFDLVPGMDYCQSRLEGNPRNDRLVSIVYYENAKSAAYALEKLHGFEYPIGNRLIVKPEYEMQGYGDPRNRDQFNERTSDYDIPRRGGPKNADLMHLAETIAQATNIIQAAGYSSADLLSNKYGSSNSQRKLQCSVDLPDPKPILNSDTEMEGRCFIVCVQQALPINVLKDVFCRFGSLIDVYLLPNRNCGFVQYASRSSMEQAIKILHGVEVNGIRLKVMEAEEPLKNKRMRLE